MYSLQFRSFARQWHDHASSGIVTVYEIANAVQLQLHVLRNTSARSLVNKLQCNLVVTGWLECIL